jgi:hypothetical protein
MISATSNFEQIKRKYAGAFAALERTASRYGIDFYLTGTKARSVWMDHQKVFKNLPSGIDFAASVSSSTVWNNLVQHITTKENFYQERTNPYCFHYRRTRIHLIPFAVTGIFEEGYPDVREQSVMINGKNRVLTMTGLLAVKLFGSDEEQDLN